MSSSHHGVDGPVRYVQQGNRRLREQYGEPPAQTGPGRYSSPFRGSLFGHSKSEDVARELQTRRVDVLWLGSNPGVRESLQQIVNPTSGNADLPELERQSASGLFSARRWISSIASEGWNQVERPRGGCKVYRDVFMSMFGTLSAVAMANFIPWGSQDMKTSVVQLGEMGAALLTRAVECADAINVDIVRALRPRLLVVPFSLGKNGRFGRTYPAGVTIAQASDVRRQAIAGVEFVTGMCQRAEMQVPTIYEPHPSWFRFRSGQATAQLTRETPRILGPLL